MSEEEEEKEKGSTPDLRRSWRLGTASQASLLKNGRAGSLECVVHTPGVLCVLSFIVYRLSFVRWLPFGCIVCLCLSFHCLFLLLSPVYSSASVATVCFYLHFLCLPVIALLLCTQSSLISLASQPACLCLSCAFCFHDFYAFLYVFYASLRSTMLCFYKLYVESLLHFLYHLSRRLFLISYCGYSLASCAGRRVYSFFFPSRFTVSYRSQIDGCSCFSPLISLDYRSACLDAFLGRATISSHCALPSSF